MIREIRPGHRMEYRIVRRQCYYGSRYRIQYRDPDATIILRRYWWQFWRPTTPWQLVVHPDWGSSIMGFDDCRSAERGINAHIRQLRGIVEGWVPVTCPDDVTGNS